MFDLVIKNACIVDGTGNPWFNGSVAVKSDKIAKVTRSALGSAERYIDANGMILCPGFVDIHSHSDFTLLVDSTAQSKVRQGVTTEVVGNCGISASPMEGGAEKFVRGFSQFSAVEKMAFHWATMSGYMRCLEKQGVALNVAPLVGHGTVRAAVMGLDPREATRSELNEMTILVEESMREGAFGLSSMMAVPPSCYAAREELKQLCRVVKRYGGYYATHMREIHWRALHEPIDLGESTGIALQISHFGSSVDREVETGLKIIDQARSKGVEVTVDLYPYLAGSGPLLSNMPSKYQYADEGKLIRSLKDPSFREKVRADWQESLRAIYGSKPWASIMIVSSRRSGDYEGRYVDEIAKSKGVDSFDIVFDILAEEGSGVWIAGFHIREENLSLVMRHPSSMIGSDGFAIAPKGKLGEGKPHPRYYGTYPRVLSIYVREKRILCLEDAIRKMTSMPARKLGIRDRGVIQQRAFADMVIFDPRRIADTATYKDPHRFPVGIEYVIVNGEIVVDKSGQRHVLPGKVLRRR